MATQTPKYTITNDSIIVIWEGKASTIKRGDARFLNLQKAILNSEWDEIPKHLTVAKSLQAWAKGKFTLDGDKFFYGEVALPESLNKRIRDMAAKGEDPSVLFKFWEKLQQNPSYRSVNQLWGFLQHEGIPLDKDGNILAYKSVRRDFKDHHSNSFVNTPGSVLEMSRNQISDDPTLACHVGFHVGALAYANGFGSGDRRIVICLIDPKDVVCIPYDSSAQKMRVCKYRVIGLHNGELLSSTTHVDEEGEAENDDNETVVQVEEEVVASDVSETKPVSNVVTTATEEAEFDAMDKLDMLGLMEKSTSLLRAYARKRMKIINASKMPGGKTVLVTKILNERS